MSDEARAIQRRVHDAVRETLDAYRTQKTARPVSEKSREDLLFRGAQAVVASLSPYPRAQRYALMPSVIQFMLESLLDAAGTPVAGGEGWLPTAANVNALPEGIRRYVHDLEEAVLGTAQRSWTR